MSMLATMATAGGGAAKLYVDDVFSAYTYTGNGANKTINNGIDLAGKGGLVWLKDRNSGAKGHGLYDTARGINKRLQTQSANGQVIAANQLTAFGADGFTLGSDGDGNGTGTAYVGWTFRKAQKFFDVVTYTGNGGTNNVPHALGIAPGMVIIKRVDVATDWYVIHRAGGSVQRHILNSNGPSIVVGGVIGDAATFDVAAFSGFSSNTSGASYVAYVFAHDPSPDGLIQCGSFTTDGAGKADVNLGWEPQFVLFKQASDAFGGTDGNWRLVDTARGMGASSSNPQTLYANTPDAEIANYYRVAITATGMVGHNFTASTQILYMAIRRPNKPPTTGTQVYNAIARTGTGVAAPVTGVGFAPDLMLTINRNAVVSTYHPFIDKLRGVAPTLLANYASDEGSFGTSGVASFDMDGVSLAGQTPWNGSSIYINHFFKRASGVFDVVCQSSGNSTNSLYKHNLEAAPELIIIKSRNGAGHWFVYHKDFGRSKYSFINFDVPFSSATNIWGLSDPTATTFFASDGATGMSYQSFAVVAYLFATKPGISKVGSYTGNGSSQTINCGFAAGARFILIKRTDAAGDWYVWDSARGIVAGNDPHLSLNTTAAEVTSNDSVDPDASGFIVNQVAATNINVLNGTYIYLAFA